MAFSSWHGFQSNGSILAIGVIISTQQWVFENMSQAKNESVTQTWEFIFYSLNFDSSLPMRRAMCSIVEGWDFNKVCRDRGSIYAFVFDQSKTLYSVEYIHVIMRVVNALRRKKYPIEYQFHCWYLSVQCEIRRKGNASFVVLFIHLFQNSDYFWNRLIMVLGLSGVQFGL